MADTHHDHTPPGGATDLVEASIAVLRGRGERLTTPRRLVIEELAATTGHLSADDLLERVTTRSPGVHLATVYRTLEEQIGYEWKKADASRPWLVIGTLLAMLAAAGSLTAHRRIP